MDTLTEKIANLKKLKFIYLSLRLMIRKLRGSLLNLKVSNVGCSPLIDGKFIIKNKGQFTIGNNFSMKSKPYPVFITVFKDANLTIGDNVFVNYGVDIGCTKKITIGNNVLIGALTNIIDNNFHPVDSDDIVIGKEIIIQDNVWIGNHSIILPGVCIGKNSVGRNCKCCYT